MKQGNWKSNKVKKKDIGRLHNQPPPQTFATGQRQFVKQDTSMAAAAMIAIRAILGYRGGR